MTPKQKPHILLTLYVSLFQDTYGYKPDINRNRDKWGFADMIEDLGMDRAREVIEWYFDSDVVHSLRGLFNSYDKISAEIDAEAADKKRLAELRQATKSKVEEFRRRRVEQSRGEGNIGSNPQQ